MHQTLSYRERQACNLQNSSFPSILNSTFRFLFESLPFSQSWDITLSFILLFVAAMLLHKSEKHVTLIQFIYKFYIINFMHVILEIAIQSPKVYLCDPCIYVSVYLYLYTYR